MKDRRSAIGDEGIEETKSKRATEITSLASRNLVGDLHEPRVYRYSQGVPCVATVKVRPRDSGRGGEKRKGNG